GPMVWSAPRWRRTRPRQSRRRPCSPPPRARDPAPPPHLAQPACPGPEAARETAAPAAALPRRARRLWARPGPAAPAAGDLHRGYARDQGGRRTRASPPQRCRHAGGDRTGHRPGPGWRRAPRPPDLPGRRLPEPERRTGLGQPRRSRRANRRSEGGRVGLSAGRAVHARPAPIVGLPGAPPRPDEAGPPRGGAAPPPGAAAAPTP